MRKILVAVGFGLEVTGAAAMNLWPDRIWIATVLFVAGLIPLGWVVCAWPIRWLGRHRWEDRELLRDAAISYRALLEERNALRERLRQIEAVQRKYAPSFEPRQLQGLAEIQKSLDQMRAAIAAGKRESRESDEELERRSDFLIRRWIRTPKPPKLWACKTSGRP